MQKVSYASSDNPLGRSVLHSAERLGWRGDVLISSCVCLLLERDVPCWKQVSSGALRESAQDI